MTLESLLWVVGWVVLHALWQGSMIGLAVFAILRLHRASNARTRYRMATGGLFMFLGVVVATAVWFGASVERSSPSFQTTASMLADGDGDGGGVAELEDASPVVAGRTDAWWIAHAPMFAAWCWVLGVVSLTTRMLVQWRRMQVLRTGGTVPPGRELSGRFDRIKARLSMAAPIELRISDQADSPMVLGWWRPLILVPASTVTSLTPEQLETILTHELLHIARRDHLLNMIQAFAEIVLFFHPATWWLSRQIRLERENCCDDATIQAGGSPRHLAEALLILETLRTHRYPNQAALSATGGSLMNRIERLFECNRPTRIDGGWRLMSACTIVAMGGILLGTTMVATPVFAQADGTRMTESASKNDAKRDDARRRDRIERRLEMLAESLKGQVESGELTSEEAEAEYEAAKKRLMRRVKAAENRDVEASGRKATVDLVALKSGIEQRLKKMSEMLDKQVDAGEMSEADAKAKFAEAEKRMWARYRVAEERQADPAGDQTKTDLGALKSQIEARLAKLGESLKKQVAAGEISAEEGERRFKEAETSLWSRYRKAEMTQMNANGADVDPLASLRAKGRERLRVFADQLQKKVESGDLTVEEAEAELEIATQKVQRRLRAAYAKAMDGVDETGRDATAEGEGELAALKAGIEARLRKMGEGLRRQVAAGELTAEDARAKFEAAEREMWMRYRAAEAKERED